ncbi:hypothetical protein P691DRAFT_789928 [Macrolepiota fuliginosa MF-IS2]|uniref:Uncharacterized protein n=1 Tax=Macrolepiota fuliginosa MF-IS2 TaxID=1400762 RepID=A0A9P6C6D8_9AGAR|nr:hypothetical protein P691DRAFT_789928 [Macrolepiota fuliginosa MF-IS2]
MSENKDIEYGHNLEYATGQQKHTRYNRMANPMPSLHTRGVQTPNMIIGMSVFSGGLLMLLVGIWEIPHGDVCGATAFGLYLIVWFMVTVMFIWNGMASINKAGGILGLIDGLIAFYIGLSMMLSAEKTAIIHLPLGDWSEA